MASCNPSNEGGRSPLSGLALCLLCLLVLLLCSGCVQYRVDLNFNWLTGGTIVQNLSWDRTLNTFLGELSDEFTDELLQEIEQRAAAAGGTVQAVSDNRVRVEIPFDNYTQLEDKFNRFFDRPLLLLSNLDAIPKSDLRPAAAQPSKPLVPPLRSLPSAALAQSANREDFHIDRHGYWVADRYDMIYQLDLEDLRLPIPNGFLSFSADRLLDLQFGLKLPIPPSRSNATLQQDNQLVWQIEPGASNLLSASFWLPSPLGAGLLLGAIAIALVVGWYQLGQHRPRARRQNSDRLRLPNGDR
ncbi:DUF3153 domain-containing protein [Synechococcus sp. PCC 7336]|uniref:DUF3153 domain-containing protein n=1 Tax=Synechococcus sp. PCC 7336 TaxID=195250 RepID=UPI00034B9E12|nr:DUF3153 domain-containing protein [Synechococcus sp. PCC 7336]